MDRSEEYIEMCTKAVEIQKPSVEIKKELVDGDFYVTLTGCIARCFNNELWQMGYPKDVDENKTPIWLPRQDQLQEFLKDDFENSMELLTEFGLTLFDSGSVSNSDDYGSYEKFKESAEKMWLAFVMKSKFNKTWNPNSKEWGACDD